MRCSPIAAAPGFAFALAGPRARVIAVGCASRRSARFREPPRAAVDANVKTSDQRACCPCAGTSSRGDNVRVTTGTTTESEGVLGGRCRIRTCDPCRVKPRKQALQTLPAAHETSPRGHGAVRFSSETAANDLAIFGAAGKV